MGTNVFTFCMSVLGDAESGICCGLAGKELFVQPHNFVCDITRVLRVCACVWRGGWGAYMEMIE